MKTLVNSYSLVTNAAIGFGVGGPTITARFNELNVQEFEKASRIILDAVYLTFEAQDSGTLSTTICRGVIGSLTYYTNAGSIPYPLLGSFDSIAPLSQTPVGLLANANQFTLRLRDNQALENLCIERPPVTSLSFSAVEFNAVFDVTYPLPAAYNFSATFTLKYFYQ